MRSAAVLALNMFTTTIADEITKYTKYKKAEPKQALREREREKLNGGYFKCIKRNNKLPSDINRQKGSHVMLMMSHPY